MKNFSHCKKFLSYVEIKHLLVQVVPIAPCLTHMTPCEESLCPLFSCILDTGILWWCLPPSLLFSRVQRPNSFSLLSEDKFSRSVVIFVALLLTLSLSVYLVSSANLVSVLSVPSSRSFMKMLNTLEPSINQWGTLLLTCYQPEWKPPLSANC